MGFLQRRASYHFNAYKIKHAFQCLLKHGDNGSPHTCVIPPSYSKIIVLLVDAFRYDFAVWNETLSQSEALPYQNRMPHLHQLLKHSKNSKLFKIYADPPTTTMQRIKGHWTENIGKFR